MGAGHVRTDFGQFGGKSGFERMDSCQFYFGRVLWCERTDCGQFSLREGVVVLKALILGNFNFGNMCCLERTDFGELPLWEGMMDLKGLFFSNFSLEGSDGLVCTDFG